VKLITQLKAGKMNNTKINMNGTEVHSEILKHLKNVKQGKLLESNFIQVRHSISNDMIQHTHLDVVEISKREMIQKLSHQLLEKYKDSFEESNSPFGKEFSLSVLVMSTGELKHIVEYCIRNMPESAIQEIKK
jgi:hypothetical protein